MTNSSIDNIDTHGFRIYGDNIDECVRFSEILVDHAESYGLELVDASKKYSAPIYTFSPRSNLTDEDFYLSFQVCGRFGEWEEDRRPYLGPEDTDIILTEVEEPGSPGSPILGIEFNNAIGAGNNAWQRFPRIANSIRREVPFIYTVPVCDAEVYDGNIRSLRHPNTNIPIAQLILMMRYRTSCLTIYEDSPWYQDGLDDNNAVPTVDGNDFYSQLIDIIFSLIVEEVCNPQTNQQLYERALNLKKEAFNGALVNMLEYIRHFIESDFTILENHPILSPSQTHDFIDELWDHIHGNQEISSNYLIHNWTTSQLGKADSFSKSTSTDSKFMDKLNPQLSISQSNLKDEIKDFALLWNYEHDDFSSLTKPELMDLMNSSSQSTKKPVSYKPPSNEIAFITQIDVFAELLRDTYPSLAPTDIFNRIENSDGPLLFLPLAGYVEDTGGPAFSRPDKGGISLMNTLFGNSDIFGEKLILFYHSEIPESFDDDLDRAQQMLDGQIVQSKPNNLWIESARFSTLVIVGHLERGWIRN